MPIPDATAIRGWGESKITQPCWGGVAYSRSVQSNPQTAGVGAGLQSNRTRRQPDSTCLIS